MVLVSQESYHDLLLQYLMLVLKEMVMVNETELVVKLSDKKVALGLQHIHT